MRVKKCLSILLTLVMVLSLLPTTALAADRGTVKVPYINNLGEEASADATPLTGSETELGTGFYAVTDNVTFNHPVTVTGPATRIILCDGKTAAFSSISVSTTGNCQLLFYGQEEGSGSLTATNLTGSLIYIYGGTISAGTMTATPLNMFDGTLSADALTVGWYADFTMSSHFFGGIVDVDTLTVQDHDFTIGTENTPSPTDSFCAGSYVIAQGLKLHFANTFTAAEPDGNGAYIRYSGDYDNSAAAALNGKTLRPYITHTVNWVVEGETKETDTVLSGSPASYDGATPTKPDEQGKKYIFSGWSDGTNTYAPDALPPVTADVTYTAVFVAGHGIKVWYMYINPNPDMPNDPSSTVTPSVDVARAGETVTLTVNAAPKEKLTEQQSYSANSNSSVTLTNGFLAYSSSEIISIEKSGDSYSFVMPDAEVTIIAFFDYFNYSITVNESIHGHMDVYKLNGNEMTAVTAADEGDEIHVRLTADPDDPYIVTGMTYTYTEDGENKTGEISLTNEINQLYLGTFTMPASDVVINITDQTAHRIVYESSALKQEYFSEAAGKTVTLTPENGYTVTSVYVKCGDEYITVTANADGTFSFMMPDGDVTVFTEFSYIDLDGSAKTSTPTIIAGDMTDLGTGWYAVDGNITNNNRISINGDVNLILCDGAALTAPKGISVNSGNSLTIWGQTAGTGMLNVYSGSDVESDCAGIGSDKNKNSGTITINGGTVKAKARSNAAGIGGGYADSGTAGVGIVVINGGTVIARGGSYGAGIGGGRSFSLNGGRSSITINGGKVEATGIYGGAGIGGGRNSSAEVVINGGNVTADYDMNGCGIGNGDQGSGSTITLSWTDADDSIRALSYSGTVTLGKDFANGTNVYAAGVIANNAAINNKTLTPTIIRTITFSPGTGSGSMDPICAADNSVYTLPACGFDVPEGQAFKEWSVKIGDADPVSRQPGATITVTADTTVTAVWKAVPFFQGHALVLSDEIGVKFGMNLDALTAEEKAASCMIFTVNGEETCVDTADAVLLADGRYQYSCFVNSLQMAEKVHAVFHYGENGAQSTEDYYSVEDYVRYICEHSKEYTNTAVDLAKAIADYGHYAQIFLSEVNNIPDGKYADMDTFYEQSYDLDAVKEAVNGYTLNLNKGTSKVSEALMRLSLDSKTALSVRLTVEDDTPLTATATLNGETFTAEKQKDGSYIIKIVGIKASQLGDEITISGNAEGEFTVKVSALAYVRSILNSDSYSENQDAQNAVAALYYYYLRTTEFRNDSNNQQ